MAVRRHGVWAVDELDHLGLLDQRDAPQRALHHRLEQFPVLRQQLLGELPCDSVGGPRFRCQLEATDEKPANLLAQVKEVVWIAYDRCLLRQFVAGDVSRGDVLVHHRDHWREGTNHGREARCPLAGGVDDDRGLNGAFVCFNVGDGSRCVAADASHAAVCLNGDAQLAGALGKLERDAVGIEPAVIGDVHRALDSVRADERRELEGLLGGDGTDVEADSARSADLPLQGLEAVRAGGQA